MSLYEKPSKELLEKLTPYKKATEYIEVSRPINHYNKLYREVVFVKKYTKKFSIEPENYMYIDENDEVITDKILCERLAKIFYYMDIYMNEEKGSVLAALQKEGEIQKDADDTEKVLEALKIIGKKEPEGVGRVIDIIKKLPTLRIKTNEKLEALKKVLEEEKKNNQYFNERMIEVLHPYYRQVMEVNYEKMLLIGRGKDYYGSLKRKAEKTRRMQNLLLYTKNSECLLRLNYILGYYENLLKAYGNVLTMNYNQYIRTLDNAGKKIAENKMYLLRNDTLNKK
ncbi:MAG: hypothetical protein ACRCW0_01465 [Clostridium sp.]